MAGVQRQGSLFASIIMMMMACVIADHLLRQWDEAAVESREQPWELADRLGGPLKALLDDLDAQSAAVSADATLAADHTLRVLLVEADPGQAMLTGAQLEARGCALRFESDPATLWQALTLWPCHAVVIDAVMDADPTRDLAHQLRLTPQFAHIAVVGFCESASAAELDAALEAGCDAALSRTADAGDLLAQIRRAVARPDRSGIDFD